MAYVIGGIFPSSIYSLASDTNAQLQKRHVGPHGEIINRKSHSRNRLLSHDSRVFVILFGPIKLSACRPNPWNNRNHSIPVN